MPTRRRSRRTSSRRSRRLSGGRDSDALLRWKAARDEALKAKQRQFTYNDRTYQRIRDTKKYKCIEELSQPRGCYQGDREKKLSGGKKAKKPEWQEAATAEQKRLEEKAAKKKAAEKKRLERSCDDPNKERIQHEGKVKGRCVHKKVWTKVTLKEKYGGEEKYYFQRGKQWFLDDNFYGKKVNTPQRLLQKNRFMVERIERERDGTWEVIYDAAAPCEDENKERNANGRCVNKKVWTKVTLKDGEEEYYYQRGKQWYRTGDSGREMKSIQPKILRKEFRGMVQRIVRDGKVIYEEPLMGGRKVRTGPRGGRYVLKGGKKVYL